MKKIIKDRNITPFSIFMKDKYDFFRTVYPRLSRKEFKTFIFKKWNEIKYENPEIFEKYKREALK
jgi:hypothetical protein